MTLNIAILASNYNRWIFVLSLPLQGYLTARVYFLALIFTNSNGNDRLFGDFGNDTLTGGNGKGKFVLAATQGTDIITDFCKDTDLIGLSGGLSFSQLSFSGHKIIVTATDEVLATLMGINTTTLIAVNFTIV